MNILEQLLSDIAVLWAVIDPIGTIPVFIAITKGYSDIEKRSIAKFSFFVSLGVLLFFLVVGEVILRYVGVSLSAFQISGGIILFLFALDMVFGESKPESEVQLAKNSNETAVFPLAVPSIAGPGAILAIVLLTDNSRHSVLSQGVTALAMLIVLIVTYILMRAAGKIHQKIGNSGAIIISKVMGLILASIAANAILLGIKEFFDT